MASAYVDSFLKAQSAGSPLMQMLLALSRDKANARQFQAQMDLRREQMMADRDYRNRELAFRQEDRKAYRDLMERLQTLRGTQAKEAYSHKSKVDEGVAIRGEKRRFKLKKEEAQFLEELGLNGFKLRLDSKTQARLKELGFIQKGQKELNATQFKQVMEQAAYSRETGKLADERRQGYKRENLATMLQNTLKANQSAFNNTMSLEKFKKSAREDLAKISHQHRLSEHQADAAVKIFLNSKNREAALNRLKMELGDRDKSRALSAWQKLQEIADRKENRSFLKSMSKMTHEQSKELEGFRHTNRKEIVEFQAKEQRRALQVQKDIAELQESGRNTRHSLGLQEGARQFDANMLEKEVSRAESSRLAEKGWDVQKDITQINLAGANQRTAMQLGAQSANAQADREQREKHWQREQGFREYSQAMGHNLKVKQYELTKRRAALQNALARSKDEREKAYLQQQLKESDNRMRLNEARLKLSKDRAEFDKQVKRAGMIAPFFQRELQQIGEIDKRIDLINRTIEDSGPNPALESELYQLIQMRQRATAKSNFSGEKLWQNVFGGEEGYQRNTYSPTGATKQSLKNIRQSKDASTAEHIGNTYRNSLDTMRDKMIRPYFPEMEKDAGKGFQKGMDYLQQNFTPYPSEAEGVIGDVYRSLFGAAGGGQSFLPQLMNQPSDIRTNPSMVAMRPNSPFIQGIHTPKTPGEYMQEMQAQGGGLMASFMGSGAMV